MADETDCVFCGIVAGEIPSHTVHEGEHTYAFLDANPLARGHTLVIPRAHHERLNDLPAERARDLMDTVREVVPAVEEGVDAPATTVAVNNGEAAGQEVPHVHVHVVPRSPADGGRPIHALVTDRPDLDDDELASVATAVGDRL
jgi:histidine triad (HIT) family protein